MKLRYRHLLLAPPMLLALMGHGGGGCSDADTDADQVGPLTGATCPDGSTLTYASFGQQFMQTYCVTCHASTLTGAERRGAPEFHDFDTQQGIIDVADHVDQVAGIGPDAANRAMPPLDEDNLGLLYPTDAEREDLAEWIACGLP